LALRDALAELAKANLGGDRKSEDFKSSLVNLPNLIQPINAPARDGFAHCDADITTVIGVSRLALMPVPNLGRSSRANARLSIKRHFRGRVARLKLPSFEAAKPLNRRHLLRSDCVVRSEPRHSIASLSATANPKAARSIALRLRRRRCSLDQSYPRLHG
jgi:hypothetical protein